MRAEGIIINTLKRPAGEKGLKVVMPNAILSEGHLKKADHNLIVMTDLKRLGHEDWVVISAYYAMYQSAMSLLTRIGLDSKDHAATAAVLEYFFSGHIGNELIGKFNELKEHKDKIEAITINEKYIDYLWEVKQAREAAQYGISISYKETSIVIGNAREFVSKIKIVLSGLDGKIVDGIVKKVKSLQSFAMKNNA